MFVAGPKNGVDKSCAKLTKWEAGTDCGFGHSVSAPFVNLGKVASTRSASIFLFCATFVF